VAAFLEGLKKAKQGEQALTPSTVLKLWWRSVH